MTDDVQCLLWTSSEAGAARKRKAGDAIVAIAAVLAERTPLAGGEREFLATLDKLERESPDATRAMWGTPQAYVWIREAYDLVRAAVRAGSGIGGQGASAAAEKLADHLDAFKRFAIAVALTGRMNLRLDRPFETVLPCDLPNTPWSLVGEAGMATITGVADGGILVAADDREMRLSLDDTKPCPSTGLAIETCPIVTHAGCRIFLKPDAFQGPGLAGASAPREAGIAFHRAHAADVEAAVMAIHRHDPETFAHLRDDIAIIGLKPVGAGNYGNTTLSRMPGAFVTSPLRSPVALADDLIHETYHNRLFALEERGPFFENESARTDACHYSPWRSDPRPVFGVFHAFYVFTRVMRFWRLVYVDLIASDAAADREHIRYATQRLLELLGQLSEARTTLRTANGLTPWGAEVFAAMEAEFELERNRVEALGLPDDMPVFTVAEDGRYVPQAADTASRPFSVKESLRRHREAFDRLMHTAQARSSLKADQATASSKYASPPLTTRPGTPGR